MKCKVKLFSTSPHCRAADGSYIPSDVVVSWLNSDSYRNAASGRTMLVGLTHRRRNLQAGKNFNPLLKTTIGRDDSALLTDSLGDAPVGYIESLELNNADQWVYGIVALFDEKLADPAAADSIKRIKYLLKSGCRIGISSVVLGYWSSEGKSGDILKKLCAIRGADWTLNPSWADAGAIEIYGDDGERLDEVVREFSEKEGEVTVKCFSDLGSLADGFLPTSKIDGKFTELKAKEFSTIIEVKEFSVGALRERIRYAKFNPRMRLRRLFIDYKMLVKQLGGAEKMDEETSKILRSLFTTDILDIFKTITPEIMSGKNLQTLLGTSALGQNIRQASQKLLIPCRLAYQEMSKKGTLSPIRLKKLQEAYNEFIHSMVEEVFGSNPLPEGLEQEDDE